MDEIQRQVEEARRIPPDFLAPTEIAPEPEFPFQRALASIAAPDLTERDDTVDAARTHMRDTMNAYLAQANPQEILLLKVAPGSGKTTAAVEIAEQEALNGRRVLYAGPRHDFYADLLAIAKHPELWYEWLPRQAEDPDKGRPATCNHSEAVKLWINKGYEAQQFCVGVCGWDYINRGCPWHAQKAVRQPIIYGQHAHVALAHPLKFGLCIIDECPVPAFMHEWLIPAKWIAPSGMDPMQQITQMLHALAGLAVGSGALEGPALLQQLGGPRAVFDACQEFRLAADAVALAPDVHYGRDAERADYFHLPALVNLLWREASAAIAGQEYPHRVILSGGNLLLLLRQPGNDQLPRHIIALDATAEPHQYEAVFRRPVHVVDVQPKLRGRVYQVYDRANGKSSLVKNGEQTNLAGQLKAQVTAVARRYQNPAVITFQALGDSLDGLPSLHFYAARGTNQFERCDALIVAGTPQPPRQQLDKMARMIFAERMTPFAAGWTTALKPYAYRDPADGMGRAYPISGFWSDPDLQAVLWSAREAELVQAAHRVRPVLREVDIWLLTNIPLAELPPTRLLSIREVMDAPDGVNAWKWDAVLWYAQGLAGEQGYVTAQDLATAFDLNRETAHKYLDILVRQFGWEKAAAPSSGGRPPRAVRPV